MVEMLNSESPETRTSRQVLVIAVFMFRSGLARSVPLATPVLSRTVGNGTGVGRVAKF